MTPVAFQRVNTTGHECYICKVESSSPFIAHEINAQNEIGHHVHERCLKIWVRTHAHQCPVCTRPFDERCVFLIETPEELDDVDDMEDLEDPEDIEFQDLDLVPRTMREDAIESLREGIDMACIPAVVMGVFVGTAFIVRGQLPQTQFRVRIFGDEPRDVALFGAIGVFGFFAITFLVSLMMRRLRPRDF